MSKEEQLYLQKIGIKLSCKSLILQSESANQSKKHYKQSK